MLSGDNNSTYHVELLWEIKEVIYLKNLEKSLAYRKS